MTKPRASLLDRLLNVFADVRAGEGLRALLLVITLFLILSAYYVLKVAREGLILTGGTFGLEGDELKTYANGAMALLLIGVIPAYGALASRVRRKRLIDVSYAAIVISLGVFFVLGGAGVPVGLAFFVWLGIVSIFVIAQFWSFANDLYGEDEGKRLFGMIAIGGSAGAIVGPQLAKLAVWLGAGTYGTMVMAGVMFALAMLLFGVVDAMSKHAAAHGAAHDATDAPLERAGGFQLVLHDRYLGLIAVMLVLTNLVNTTGEYILSNVAKEHAANVVPAAQFASADALKAARGEAIGTFYADFFFWVNLIGLAIQALLASRFLKHAGVRVALLVLPVIALGGYAAIGLIGGLLLIRVAKTAENSTDYSLQNTVKQALFLPTSREVKYKAKAALDTFFVRFGDTASALLVGLGIHTLGFGRDELALTNVAICAVWLVIAIAIGRAFVRRSRAPREAAPAKP